MKLLKEIHRKEGLNLGGRAFNRKAVRAIILDAPKLLMVFSVLNGDYKFPGGGMHRDESPAQALRREVLEECGARLFGIARPFGKVIEYDKSVQRGYDLFMLTSYYYWCQIEGLLGQQNLDDYERELGFTPRWVEVDEAIQTNSVVLQNDTQPAPFWAVRELFVLGQVKTALEGGGV